jgi:hypothetical protein
MTLFVFHHDLISVSNVIKFTLELTDLNIKTPA